MGFLMIDHRGGCDPTGMKDGRLEEFDTISCPHCQAVIKKKVMGPCRTVVDSPGECDFCRKPICHNCAALLRIDDYCPGEMRIRVLKAWEQFNRANALIIAMRR